MYAQNQKLKQPENHPFEKKCHVRQLFFPWIGFSGKVAIQSQEEKLKICPKVWPNKRPRKQRACEIRTLKPIGFVCTPPATRKESPL